MKTLFLPAITGKFGQWRFYQVIIKIGDLVKNHSTDENPIYRIKTVDEVEEIYSQKGIGRMLQRVFDKERLTPIKNYLTKQSDRYINNLTIAIFGGDPNWIPIDFKSTGFEEVSEELGEEIEKNYGVIKLTGQETLFVLDGQHRIKSLRQAIIELPELASDSIAATLIIHTDSEDGRKKTRRLFTTVNRYAKPVSKGESILLDEDDLSAIITRKTIEEYKHFKGKSLIAKEKGASLNFPRNELHFTSVITLWNINELLIDAQKVYPPFDGSKTNLVRVRPDDAVIEKYTKVVFDFWDTFFEQFPAATKFITDPENNKRGKVGAFSLRPIGQAIFCSLFLALKSMGRLNRLGEYITAFPDDLSDPFWHFIMINPHNNNVLKSEPFARKFLFYQLGLPLKPTEKLTLLKQYRASKQDASISLPEPRIKGNELFLK